MLKYLNNKKNLIVILTILVVLIVLNNTAFPARERTDRQDQKDDTPTPEQKAQQEAQTAADDIDDILVKILELIDQNQKPSQENIATAENALQMGKRHLKSYDEPTQCQLYLLNAWVSYYQDDLNTALQAATKAYRTDQENNDARATQALMAILSEKPPIIIRERPQKEEENDRNDRRSRRPRATGPGMPGMGGPGANTQVNTRASTGDILYFDVDDINTELLGQQIPPMQLNCINSTKFSYTPGTNLCILFWQLFEKDEIDVEASGFEGDPNELGIKTSKSKKAEQKSSSRKSSSRREQTQPPMPPGMGPMGPGMMMPGMMPPGMMPPGSSSRSRRTSRTRNTNMDPFTEQTTSFAEIYAEQFANPQMSFVAINTDNITQKNAVMKKLLESPWPWAQVASADPLSGAAQFAEVDAQKPLLTIVSADAKVKYAGPAAGFMTPIIMEKFVPQTNAESGTPAGTAPGFGLKDMLKMFTPPQATPPQPAETPTQTPPAQTQPQQDDEYSADDYQAEKLVANAEQFIKLGRLTTYKKGIDLCRQILNDYPNTKYAEQAQQLLRQIPERYRQTYNITNEEMGL